MKDFFESPESVDYAERVLLIDQYYDALVKVMTHLQVGEKAVPFWEIEDKIRDEILNDDPAKLECMMKSVVINGQDFTSMHEIEQLRVMSHGEAFKLHLGAFLARTAEEKAS